jgi:integrase
VSYSWRVDTIAPTAGLTGPTAVGTLSSSVKVSWSGADTGGSGVAKYQVGYARAVYSSCVEALRKQRVQQASDRLLAGEWWSETGLVFTTAVGTAMDAANVRRDFRRALGLVPSVDPGDWTPRELRHSFVSLLSDAGVPLEEISRLVGHSGTSVTELVYRHQIRPVIQTGATVMDALFDNKTRGA